MAGPLTQMAGWVEILADDPTAAERILRPGVETLREIGELAWMSTVAAILAEALWAQGRDEEAESFTLVSEEGAGAEDVYSQGMLGSVRAKVMARRGEAVEAERLGRVAVTIAEPTDFLFLRAFTLTSLAEVLLLGGEAERAEDVIGEALAVCEQKGFLVGVERIRKLQGATGSR
jgi:ATP/maltotriose-dependent transcriptional regulator MalT